LSLVVRVGVVSVAAILAALSTVVLLSFAVSALGQPDGVEKIIKVFVASAAGFAFFLVGRGIWRDLMRRSSVKPKERPTKERGR
jgi:hypothetical protein